jgi:uncharacterized protein
MHTVRLKVRVVPNASRSELAEWQDDVVRIRLNAAPVAGKPNKALQNFLATKLGIRERDLTIVHGEGSRLKCVDIQDAPPDWRSRLS